VGAREFDHGDRLEQGPPQGGSRPPGRVQPDEEGSQGRVEQPQFSLEGARDRFELPTVQWHGNVTVVEGGGWQLVQARSGPARPRSKSAATTIRCCARSKRPRRSSRPGAIRSPSRGVRRGRGRRQGRLLRRGREVLGQRRGRDRPPRPAHQRRRRRAFALRPRRPPGGPHARRRRRRLHLAERPHARSRQEWRRRPPGAPHDRDDLRAVGAARPGPAAREGRHRRRARSRTSTRGKASSISSATPRRSCRSSTRASRDPQAQGRGRQPWPRDEAGRRRRRQGDEPELDAAQRGRRKALAHGRRRARADAPRPRRVVRQSHPEHDAIRRGEPPRDRHGRETHRGLDRRRRRLVGFGLSLPRRRRRPSAISAPARSSR
jgi:hypothetical protein